MVEHTDRYETNDEFGVPIYTFLRGTQQQYRISLNEYRGHRYIDLRIFWASPNGWRPTRRGITLPPDLLPELVRGVFAVAEALGHTAEEIAAWLE